MNLDRLRWSEAILHCERKGQGYVIATILNSNGSVPRNAGSKMVIDHTNIYDTIGGGQLEFLVIHHARQLLHDNQAGQWVKPFPLAAEAAQCCGGHVTVLLESFAAVDWHIVLYGAGHVSQALLTILADLPCRVSLIDSRTELLPKQLPDNVFADFNSDPASSVARLPRHAWVIVFTHDHTLDYQLCCELLRRDDLAFVGLIGSKTKSERFRYRLLRDGISEAALNTLVCPIGLPEVSGKRPMEIAVSISAQLLGLYYAGKPAAGKNTSTSWRDMKSLVTPLSDAQLTSLQAATNEH